LFLAFPYPFYPPPRVSVRNPAHPFLAPFLCLSLSGPLLFPRFTPLLLVPKLSPLARLLFLVFGPPNAVFEWAILNFYFWQCFHFPPSPPSVFFRPGSWSSSSFPVKECFSPPPCAPLCPRSAFWSCSPLPSGPTAFPTGRVSPFHFFFPKKPKFFCSWIIFLFAPGSKLQV